MKVVMVSASGDTFPDGQLYVGRSYACDEYSCAELVCDGALAGWAFNFTDRVAASEWEPIAEIFGCPPARFGSALKNRKP